MTRAAAASRPMGPHPVETHRGIACVPVYLTNTVTPAWVSPADYPRVMGHARWRAGTDGYAYAYAWRDGRGVMLAMHRLVSRVPRTLCVDHANGDRLWNVRGNLRWATSSQNQANRRKLRPHSSRYRGVTWHRAIGRWQAAVKCEGRNHYLGVFADEDAAGRAYNEAAKRLFGRFAWLNQVVPQVAEQGRAA